MKKLLIVQFALLVLFPLSHFFELPQLVLVLGFLLTSAYLTLNIGIPWIQSRRNKRPAPSLRFHVWVVAWFMNSLVIGLLLTTAADLRARPPDPHILSKHTSRINALAFNQAATQLVSAGADSAIQVWDTSKKALAENRATPLFDLVPHYYDYQKDWQSVAFHPDGSRIAAGSSDGTIRIWNRQGNGFYQQLIAPDGGEIKALAFSGDGNSLASGTDSGGIRVWDMKGYTLLASLQGQKKEITSLAWSSDNKFLAAGAVDGTIGIWRASDNVIAGGHVFANEKNADSIIDLAFWDNRTVIAVYQDRSLVAWQFDPNGSNLQALNLTPFAVAFPSNWIRPSDRMDTAALSPSGRFLVTGDSDYHLRLWQIDEQQSTGSRTFSFSPRVEVGKQENRIASIAFDPAFDATYAEHARVVTSNTDNKIRVWNLYDAKLNTDVGTYDKAVTAVALSMTDDAVLVSSEDKTVRVWVGKNNQRSFDAPTDETMHLAFNPTGTLLASTTFKGYVRVWQFEKDKQTLAYDVYWPEGLITSIAMGKDLLAVGNVDGKIRLFTTLHTYQDLPSLSHRVESLAFSADGQVLCAATQDQVYLWSVGRPFPVNPQIAKEGLRITDLTLSPVVTDTLLAVTSLNEPLRLYQVWGSDTLSATEKLTLPDASKGASAVTFSPDGKTVITSRWDRGIQLWDLGNPAIPNELPAGDQPVRELGISADGQVLAAGTIGQGPEIQLLSVANLEELRGLRSVLANLALGSPAARLYLPLVLAEGLSFILILNLLILLSSITGLILLSDYPHYSFRQAQWFMLEVLLGINHIEQHVTAEGIQTVRAATEMASELGGIGLLIVDEGNAAVLQQRGRTTRVVGRGLSWLRPFEKAHMHIPLMGRAERIEVKEVITRDQLYIDLMELTVSHIIQKGNPDKDHEAGSRYPFDSQLILNKIWVPSATDWKQFVRTVATNTLRDAAALYNFEELVNISGRTRRELTQRLRERVGDAVKGRGIEITGVFLGEIKIGEKARALLQERSLGQVQRQIELNKADIEREVMTRKGEGEAMAINRIEETKSDLRDALIRQLTDPFCGGERAVIKDAQIAIRYIEAIEHLSLTLVRDDVTAMRYVEALENITKSAGDKTVILGEQNILDTSRPPSNGKGESAQGRTR
ncbi:MAG: SPFH domain-containing protein [Anaerolineae bacterium]